MPDSITLRTAGTVPMPRPRILWAATACLHDTSSGAAHQSRIMLECLAEQGIEVCVLGCLTFDHPSGASLFPRYADIRTSAVQWVTLRDRGVDCIYMNMAEPEIDAMRHCEQMVFMARFRDLLRQFRPDVIMQYGGGVVEQAIRAEAAVAGIPTVMAVYNGLHLGAGFSLADAVITDSRATAALYAEQGGCAVQPVGIFIRPEACIAPQRAPRYVTFVNPSLPKGVGPFMRLALMARRALPDVRFLVVESRGTWSRDPGAMREPEHPEWRADSREFWNVDIVPHQSDMRGVYAATRVLLAPSLWFEGWGRVATEAIMNGIPVLASASGGLPEAVGEGGRILPLPEACRADYSRMPSEADMRVWLDALVEMLEGQTSASTGNPCQASRAGRADSQQDSWQAAALRAASAHSLDRSTQRLLAVLNPLLQRRAGSHAKLSGQPLSVTAQHDTAFLESVVKLRTQRAGSAVGSLNIPGTPGLL